MKKTIFTLFICICALSASAQWAYISSNGPIILSSGSIEQYDAPDIFVDGRYSTTGLKWTATLMISPAGMAGSTTAKTTEIEFSKSTIDSFTSSGTGETELLQNSILQAVKAYLLALNPTVTFTLN